MSTQVDKIHAQKKMIHASLQPRHVVLVGSTWQLLDMGISCHINKPFKRNVDSNKAPSPAHCPPEMARVILGATDKGVLEVAKLKEYSKARWAGILRSRSMHLCMPCCCVARCALQLCSWGVATAITSLLCFMILTVPPIASHVTWQHRLRLVVAWLHPL